MLAPACTTPVEDSGTVATSNDDSASPADTSSPFPLLELEQSPDELVAGVAWLFELGAPEPTWLLDLYTEQLGHGDEDVEGCPGHEMMLIGVVLGCTAESGWTYSGISTYEDIEMDGEALGRSFTGDFRIISPDDEVFSVGGNAHIIAAPGSDLQVWNAMLLGSFHATADEGWLGRGISAYLQYDRYHDWLEIDGLLQSGDVAVDFESLTWGDPSCDEGPMGSIAIRDTSGLWVEWTSACGPCGDVTLDGEVVGEDVCLEVGDVRTELVDKVGW